MPRFPNLFFMEMNERKRWIGAAFMRFGRRVRVWKMQFGGLTCDFWAKNEVFGRRVRARAGTFWRVGRQLMSYMPIVEGYWNGPCYIYANPKFRAPVFDRR
jgi:hypothetical protein